jgi:hypothetical protein
MIGLFTALTDVANKPKRKEQNYISKKRMKHSQRINMLCQALRKAKNKLEVSNEILAVLFTLAICFFCLMVYYIVESMNSTCFCPSSIV